MKYLVRFVLGLCFLAVFGCVFRTVETLAAPAAGAIGIREGGAGEIWENEARRVQAGEAGETREEQAEQEEILSRLGLEEIENYLRRQEAGRDFPGIQEIMRRLMAGQAVEVTEEVLKALKDALLSQITGEGHLVGQVLTLGIFAAVFSNFSSVFRSSQIAETGFFAAYLLLFALLTVGLTASMMLAAETVSKILEFMKVLMPAYFLAVACSGAAVSAAALYEVTMALLAVGQWLLYTAMIPLVRVYLILSMSGNMMKENVFSRLTALLEQAIGWGMKTLLGAVAGIQLLQTLVLPYVDSLKNGSLRKLAELIPGVGQGMSAAVQMLLGSGVLIKNTLGAAAVVILLLLAAAPAVQLLILTLLYQWTAAVLEPVCDKRILACISASAAGHRMLLKIVLTAAFILILTVAVVCAGTNAVYYA